jgi:hypothetical protein
MKFVTALSAALISIAPVAAFAQDASTTGRGAGAKPVGPASENGDTSTGNARSPSETGRSDYPDSAAPSAPSGAESPSMGEVPPAPASR